ncbi:MAG: flagellar biosynthesis protein FlhF [Actinomycetota bacterium]|nr:flagellar biosynthesis protein FlhF [Actinomycetota bacterium]
MKIKRYEASNMEEAIARVKSDLGPEAIILHTRRLQKPWPLSLISKNAVEITAALDVNLAERGETTSSDNGAPAHNISEAIEERFDQLQLEVEEIKSIVKTIASQLTDPLFQEVPACFLDVYERLLYSKVEDDLAKKLMKNVQEQLTISELASPEILHDRLVSEIAKLIPTSPPLVLEEGQRKIIALIGPTGAGKTTTLAKLAARYCLYEGKKAAFITADTYRIAAVDQLKTYAEIIGAPIEIVFSNQDAREALEKHEDKDIILIDTAGRSPLNETQMNELASLMSVCSPDEIHLVLSVTTKMSDQMNAIKRFSIVPINRLIFTKLDETNTPGTMLNIVYKTKMAVSYLTMGQNVPEDIEVAESQKLANLILGVPLDGRSS